MFRTDAQPLSGCTTGKLGICTRILTEIHLLIVHFYLLLQNCSAARIIILYYIYNFLKLLLPNLADFKTAWVYFFI